MKKSILLVAVLLFARENPFVLPNHSASSTLKQEAASEVRQESFKQEKKEVSTKPLVDAAQMQKVADFVFLKVYIEGNTLKLDTKDRLRRTFSIDKPKKVVLDFWSKRGFASKTIPLNKGAFKKVAIGAHKNFYRVAIEVNRSCKPKITGHELICR